MAEKNITLIGMPGSGKTTIGKELAEKLGFSFIDTDRIIELKEKRSLKELITLLGNKRFVMLEEKEILKLEDINKTVVSPGGSIIYSTKAISFLKSHSVIIFLKASLEEIKKRTNNLHDRGIVGLEKGLENIYKKRNKLYKKYADFIIDVEKFNQDKIVKSILKSLEKSTSQN